MPLTVDLVIYFFDDGGRNVETILMHLCYVMHVWSYNNVCPVLLVFLPLSALCFTCLLKLNQSFAIFTFRTQSR